jgi:hypothetical protein
MLVRIEKGGGESMLLQALSGALDVLVHLGKCR